MLESSSNFSRKKNAESSGMRGGMFSERLRVMKTEHGRGRGLA